VCDEIFSFLEKEPVVVRWPHHRGVRLIALVHVRFRTENLRPTTERVISSVVVVVGALS